MNDITELVGHYVLEITEGDLVRIKTDKGEYRLYHSQDCCESVVLQRSNYAGIIGLQIQDVAWDTENELPEGFEPGTLESWTNTHVKLIGPNGTEATFYFLGTSNGYYGEGVDFGRIGAGSK